MSDWQGYIFHLGDDVAGIYDGVSFVGIVKILARAPILSGLCMKSRK